MLNSLRRSGAHAAPVTPAPFHAPLFQSLIRGRDGGSRQVVLDLGIASTPMLSLLGQVRCRVEIADVAHFGGINRLNSAERGAELATEAQSLLPNRLSGDPVNLVFCWDLPNYLSLDALLALMTAIGDRAGKGALAHALIAYSDREMPELPGCFVPTPECELINLNPTEEMIAAPRYSPEALGKHMGGFVIDRARLLSNGMQEFLFRLK